MCHYSFTMFSYFNTFLILYLCCQYLSVYILHVVDKVNK